MLQNRLNQYKFTKKFSNRELASVLQITEQKVGKILSGKYQGSFEEFEYIVNKISETPSEEYYYSTGKRLPQESAHTPNDTYIELLQTIRELTATVRGLQEEIHQMREENKSQGRITHSRSKVKVPDH